MDYLHWWTSLEVQWQRAFGEVFFMHSTIPSEEEAERLFSTEVLRFAGPGAAYANMDFQLHNLSGLRALKQLKILVVTHHDIRTLDDLKDITGLKSLFIFNNVIDSLKGIEQMKDLEQLYAHCNHIHNLQPVSGLTNLRELYVHYNQLENLSGLTAEHSEKLHTFYCKPNDKLKQKELIHTEINLGIRCKSL
ncbi:MAG: hypothetical protein PW786_00420 [Arachidicoccus sp.]|nr:hypothetical protein [Arachidicoccus sp.]